MPKLPTTPYGTRLGFTTRAQVIAFLAKEPKALPLPAPRPLPRPAALHRQAETGFLLALSLLLLVLAAFKH